MSTEYYIPSICEFARIEITEGHKRLGFDDLGKWTIWTMFYPHK
jgi:hypothetical protein